MKKYAAIFLCFGLLAGCGGFGNVSRTIYVPVPEADLSSARVLEEIDLKELVRLGLYKEIKIIARSDDLITIEIDGMKVTIDGKKRPGLIEQLITLGLIKTNINIGGDDED